MVARGSGCLQAVAHFEGGPPAERTREPRAPGPPARAAGRDHRVRHVRRPLGAESGRPARGAARFEICPSSAARLTCAGGEGARPGRPGPPAPASPGSLVTVGTRIRKGPAGIRPTSESRRQVVWSGTPIRPEHSSRVGVGCAQPLHHDVCSPGVSSSRTAAEYLASADQADSCVGARSTRARR